MSHALVLYASLGDAAAVPEGHVVIVRVVTISLLSQSESTPVRFGTALGIGLEAGLFITPYTLTMCKVLTTIAVIGYTLPERRKFL